MNLEERIVGDISGQFLIEAYQRGYRWSVDEITYLLEDIYEIPDGQDYCLQPIVVKARPSNDVKNGSEVYELIDGQQRLTTLYLIMKYLNIYIDIKYSIEYTTRKSENGKMGSRQLLENINTIDTKSSSSNIDELFIKKAYDIIRDWFKDDKAKKIRFVNKLQKNVKIIWYEVDNDEDSIKIFTRLNIGKINLTNAELVKALFLSRGVKDSLGNYAGNPYGINDRKQHEIALTWDVMEKTLHQDNFWAFITNENADDYPIRMELLFDMIEVKPSGESSYYTFNKFYKRFRSSQDKFATWELVVRNYQQLLEWYQDFDLYHQIGFLVACGSSVKDLLDLTMNTGAPLKKSEFRNKVLTEIRQTMTFTKGEGEDKETIDYDDLNYEQHHSLLQTLLLLFNVETIRQKNDHNNRFPFESYKKQGVWSLEHIHAQNSENLKTNKDWKNWLLDHKRSLESLRDDSRDLTLDKKKKIATIIQSIEQVVSNIDNPSYHGSIRDEFNTVAIEVVDLLSDGNDKIQMHSLSNMALLTVGENAALSNSTFDVKREKILEMDRNGDYIPMCTKNVFMKYYSSSNTNLHYWSDPDRRDYIKAMNATLYSHLGADSKPLKLIHTELHYGNK